MCVWWPYWFRAVCYFCYCCGWSDSVYGKWFHCFCSGRRYRRCHFSVIHCDFSMTLCVCWSNDGFQSMEREISNYYWLTPGAAAIVVVSHLDYRWCCVIRTYDDVQRCCTDSAISVSNHRRHPRCQPPPNQIEHFRKSAQNIRMNMNITICLQIHTPTFLSSNDNEAHAKRTIYISWTI